MIMSHTYKLTYFDVRAVAEPIRYLLSFAGAEFEDCRIHEEWEAIKPSTPFGKLPVLEVDGKVIHQSAAICRYLAKQSKLDGDDDWEALEIDAVVDTINDFKLHAGEYFKLAFYGGDEETKTKKLETIKTDVLPYYLPKFEEIVRQNKGHFVGGKMTWADFHWAAHSESVTAMLGFDIIQDYPLLQEVRQKVHALPAIKAWLEKRPSSSLGI